MKPPEEGIHFDPGTLREIQAFSIFVQYALMPIHFDNCEAGPDDFGALVLDKHDEKDFFERPEDDRWLRGK